VPFIKRLQKSFNGKNEQTSIMQKKQESLSRFLFRPQMKKRPPILLRWCQDNRNRSNQESKFDFLATRQQLGKIDKGQQKIKIVRSNRQSN